MTHAVVLLFCRALPVLRCRDIYRRSHEIPHPPGTTGRFSIGRSGCCRQKLSLCLFDPIRCCCNARLEDTEIRVQVGEGFRNKGGGGREGSQSVSENPSCGLLWSWSLFQHSFFFLSVFFFSWKLGIIVTLCFDLGVLVRNSFRGKRRSPLVLGDRHHVSLLCARAMQKKKEKRVAPFQPHGRALSQQRRRLFRTLVARVAAGVLSRTISDQTTAGKTTTSAI